MVQRAAPSLLAQLRQPGRLRSDHPPQHRHRGGIVNTTNPSGEPGQAHGPKITWSGPPLMAKSQRERIHFHLTPAEGTPADTAVAELLHLGATRLDNGGHRCAGAVPLADVDGNELCLAD
ncbi:MAG TPA: VOC family protein [Mycobacterium sp.]|nr:VOC family protein [Mycobacterium sp.]